ERRPDLARRQIVVEVLEVDLLSPEIGELGGEVGIFAVGGIQPADTLGGNVAAEVLGGLIGGGLGGGDHDEAPVSAIFGIKLHPRLGGGSGAGEEIEDQVTGGGGLTEKLSDQGGRLGIVEGLLAEDILDGFRALVVGAGHQAVIDI